MSSSFIRRAARPAVILPAVIVGVVAAYFFWRGDAADSRYVTAQVTRGAIIRSVIATGTVNPVTTVQVGSYVSGPIQAIYADFNAPVKAGQLIAKIDPRPFQVKVDEAVAALANARAQLGKDIADLAYKKITYERNRRLFEAEAISGDTLDSALSTYKQAVAQVALDRASILQQQANVRDAQVSLNYTNIVSPVEGNVVSRNVDVGQTVAASFQTPTLFLIARDLTQMQVDTNVSESDIGSVHNGQEGDFTVDAFPDRTFEGTVTQVRQAPITVQNVVTYDVVVTVPNAEMLLKPGMTANVTIVTARRDDVSRIPVQALRFRPQDSRHAAAQNAESSDGVAHRRKTDSRSARVWTSRDGKLFPVTVTTGLSDGNYVELLGGDLQSGDTVVMEEKRPTRAAGTTGSPLFAQMRTPH